MDQRTRVRNIFLTESEQLFWFGWAAGSRAKTEEYIQ
jgi:hypothetical protein